MISFYFVWKATRPAMHVFMKICAKWQGYYWEPIVWPPSWSMTLFRPHGANFPGPGACTTQLHKLNVNKTKSCRHMLLNMRKLATSWFQPCWCCCGNSAWVEPLSGSLFDQTVRGPGADKHKNRDFWEFWAQRCRLYYDKKSN